MVFKDCFDVCVKKCDMRTSINAIKAEASIMSTLNTGDFTPHCFGISIDMRAIITSFISVNGQPLPLDLALSKDNGIVELDIHTMFSCLLRLTCGLQFIHKKHTLHNDLKLDNIVLGTTNYSTVRPYIVDFGKACSTVAARTYHLTDEEKAEHKANHSQIAPDLRDGLVKQSACTDIFSLGRVFKRTNKTIIKSDDFYILAKECLHYHSHSRPSIEEIISKLEKLSV